MEKYYRKTIGLPIISREGQPLTRIREIIMDCEKGKVVGFFVMAGPTKVITPTDILSWNQHIVVHDIHDIIDAEEVIKIQQTIDSGFTLNKKKVYTKNGDYVGKVLDYGINNKLFELTCLVVAHSFLSVLFWNKKIIASKDIIEIKKDRIIIKNLVRPVKMKKFQVDMAPS